MNGFNFFWSVKECDVIEALNGQYYSGCELFFGLAIGNQCSLAGRLGSCKVSFFKSTEDNDVIPY